MRFDVRRLDGPFGVEVRGMDLTGGPDDKSAGQLRQLFDNHQLLLFRDQDLSGWRPVDGLPRPSARRRRRGLGIECGGRIPSRGGVAVSLRLRLYAQPDARTVPLRHRARPGCRAHSLRQQPAGSADAASLSATPSGRAPGRPHHRLGPWPRQRQDPALRRRRRECSSRRVPALRSAGGVDPPGDGGRPVVCPRTAGQPLRGLVVLGERRAPRCRLRTSLPAGQRVRARLAHRGLCGMGQPGPAARPSIQPEHGAAVIEAGRHE